MTLIAVSPHPDDAELGAGALLASYPGRKVIYVACGAVGEERRAEARAAADHLGASLVLGIVPDRTAEENEGIIRTDLEGLLSRTHARTLLIPPEDDTHQDHRAVRRAALSAARRSPVSILSYESPSAPPSWAPDLFVPVSGADASRAERAVALHASQGGRSYTEAGVLSARLRVAGLRIGGGLAEPYKVHRLVPNVAVL